MKALILVLLALTTCAAMYGSGDAVIQLTGKNFDSLVLDSDDVWVVEFYAPWW